MQILDHSGTRGAQSNYTSNLKKKKEERKEKTGVKGSSNFHSSHLTNVSWASLDEVMITVIDASPSMALFTCSCGP